MEYGILDKIQMGMLSTVGFFFNKKLLLELLNFYILW